MGITHAVRSWWRGQRQPLPRTRPAPRRSRLGLEKLEDRTCPSATTLTDLIHFHSFTSTGQQGQYTVTGTLNVPGVGPEVFSTTGHITSQRVVGPDVVASLTLGPIDLNLLGLNVHLDQLQLNIIATPGNGHLLGNLLGGTSLGHELGSIYGRNFGLGLNNVFRTADALTTPGNLAGLVSIGTPLNAQALSNQLSQQGVQAGTSTVTVLDLTVQKLHLDVLGLGVVLNPNTPLHLTITANPSGGILGQLFAQISHALDNSGNGSPSLTGTELSTILSSLTGLLFGGGTGGTSASSSATTGLTNGGLGSLLGGLGASRTTQLLLLDVGPIHLNLLGLHVDTSEVVLRVTANTGPGQLLGNLLSGLVGGGPLLGQALGGINTASGLAGSASSFNSTGTFAGNGLLDYVIGQVANQTGPKSTMTTNASTTVPILTLTLGPIDLNLLGLRVQLYSPPMNPVTVSITAVTGPGNLLGNLLADVANLLNGTPG